MAKIGNQQQYGDYPVDLFPGDGTTVNFTLKYAPGSPNAIDVYVSGIKQKVNSYSVSNTTLTFTQAPPAPASGVAHNIEVAYKGIQGIVPTPAAGSVTKQSMATPYYVARAFANNANTLTGSTGNIVKIDSKSADTSPSGNWVDTVNGWIKPTIAGFYLVSANVRGNGTAALLTGMIYKNGSVNSYGSVSPNTGYAMCMTTDVVYFNGTSDYVQIGVYNSSATISTDTGSFAANYLSVAGPF